MQRGNHVHIISAGENIHIAYPAIFRTLPAITHTYVLAESDALAISPVRETEMQRRIVRSSIETVREISKSLSIPCSRELVFSPVYRSVRDVLTKIHREHPGARFTFDLTGGSKNLCLALMSLAPWLGGEVFCGFDEKVPRRIPLPDRPVRTMMEKPNYQTILAVLLRNAPRPAGSPDNPYIPRQYLFQQVWPLYIRSRVRKPVPGAPVVQYKRGRKPANDLSPQTLSTFLAQLGATGLIEEQLGQQNMKERAYRVSDPGETAFRFFADPATNSLVKMMLEKAGSGM